jgi:Protein of unknown function (DUF2911)
MKKLIFLFTLAFGLANCSQGQQSPRLTAESNDVKVSYGQPSKRDREIFGKLVPYGEVWRTGANQATEITFAKDTKFGGEAIKAGTYSLFTIPGEKEWTIILNTELKQWGSFGYAKIKDKDVLKVKVKTAKTSGVVEKMTIRFEGSNLIIEWDTTQVSVKVG